MSAGQRRACFRAFFLTFGGIRRSAIFRRTRIPGYLVFSFADLFSRRERLLYSLLRIFTEPTCVRCRRSADRTVFPLRRRRNCNGRLWAVARGVLTAVLTLYLRLFRRRVSTCVQPPFTDVVIGAYPLPDFRFIAYARFARYGK